MIFHENCLPTDNSHEVQTLFVIFEKGQNLKLSTAANYSGALIDFELKKVLVPPPREFRRHILS